MGCWGWRGVGHTYQKLSLCCWCWFGCWCCCCCPALLSSLSVFSSCHHNVVVAAGQCWVIRENFSNCNCVTPQGPVSCVSWCPLSPDVFLSCSSDWTIQLWKRDHLSPLLGFTSTLGAACDIKWSPKWATVFGAINEGQLEIWDLNSCMWVRQSGGSVIVLCLTLCVPLILCVYHIHLSLSVWTQSLCSLLPPAWRWGPCCLPHRQTVSW